MYVLESFIAYLGVDPAEYVDGASSAKVSRKSGKRGDSGDSLIFTRLCQLKIHFHIKRSYLLNRQILMFQISIIIKKKNFFYKQKNEFLSCISRLILPSSLSNFSTYIFSLFQCHL